MEIVLVTVSVFSLLTNIFLVLRVLSLSDKLLEVKDLPIIELTTSSRQDAAGSPAAVTATNENHTYAWKNESGIQQGATSAPAPPIVNQTLPPLARPGGFV
jgi:hypothetical protein